MFQSQFLTLKCEVLDERSLPPLWDFVTTHCGCEVCACLSSVPEMLATPLDAVCTRNICEFIWYNLLIKLLSKLQVFSTTVL